MLIIEAKLKGTQAQYSKFDEAIRTGQFIRNTCLRYWEDNMGVTSNDLQKLCSVLAKNMVKNHHLAKSISDASWYQFTQWLKYFAKIYGRIVIAVPPHNTTVDCSVCGTKVKKTLSTRTYKCSKCGTILDRDRNAALNILAKGFK